MGQRPADERIAHLLCVAFVRLEGVGLAHDGRFALPIAQNHLADTGSVRLVHANRVMTGLKEKGLIDAGGGKIVVRNESRLRAFAGFEPNYLNT